MTHKTRILPVVNSIQKIALYETREKFFIVGSNNNQTKFRILRIDRTDPYDLNIIDDKVEYSEKEVKQILQNGIRVKGTSSALPKPVSAFGIVGFVKFLEGYYLLLVTERRRIASIGLHVIYKIEDTNLLYIPHEAFRIPNHNEPRYLKMFQSIDLSSNFYFSYSYNITHTFQINAALPKCLNFSSENKRNGGELFSTENTDELLTYGVRYAPNRKFVWNDYLLSKIEGKVNAEWILYIMHGFISQSNVSIFGRSVYVTLIARRSNKYAGTRFLKRGANSNGDVANEVETEQMVIDVSISSNEKMRVSSFVQLRGSVPSQWSQTVSKMVAKPAITFDLSDPYYEIAGAHFNELFRRYGSPIIILNLVKKREKKKHESQLSEQFNSAVEYLNQFLPPVHRVQYISFDMAGMNKGKEAKVMDRLAKIAKSAIAKTGFFVQNGPHMENIMEKVTSGDSVQTGIIRVNCVDCLDRTNTAQFALGKCALAYQLYYLGVLACPELKFDTDCVRLLEVLYEDHGDTLALQYGGSQLVHRIKTYRKTAPWTSQGNDIMQTLSRYYSNKFSDAEKQHAINLFLGLYIPDEYKEPIWEQNTDYYLHHPEAIGILSKKRFPLTQWWDQNIIECLPLSYDYLNKQCLTVIPNLPTNSEYIDVYNHYHRTDTLLIMGETYEFKISHSMRINFKSDAYPNTLRFSFATEFFDKTVALNGSLVTHKSNESSTNSQEITIEKQNRIIIEKKKKKKKKKPFSTYRDEKNKFKINYFSTIGAIYFINFFKKKDRTLYERYEFIASFSNGGAVEKINELFALNRKQFEFVGPVVKEDSINIYKKYSQFSLELISEDVISKYKLYSQSELDIFF
ncbi:hypothetical protein PGB90_008915 [Kerria lacca]